MAWCRIGDKPLSEPMLTQFADSYMRNKGVWVKPQRIKPRHPMWLNYPYNLPIFVRTASLVMGYYASASETILKAVCKTNPRHYSDVIMNAMASQVTSVSIVCSTACSGTDQIKYQSSTSLAFLRGIHRWPVDSTHKGSVTRKMFPFDDIIMVKPQPNTAKHEPCA